MRIKLNPSVSKYTKNFLRKISLTAVTQSVLHPAHSENYYLVLCTWLGIDPYSDIPICSSLPLGPLIGLRNSPGFLLPLQTFGLDRLQVPFGISNMCKHQRWCFLQLHRDRTQLTRCSRWQLWARKMLARADQSNLDKVFLLKNHICKKMHHFSERNHQGSLLDSGLNFF